MRRGRRTWSGMTFEFVFDAYECTSASSLSSHTIGRRVTTAVVAVRSSERRAGERIVRCTCLAIGSGFERLPRKIRPSFERLLAEKRADEWDDNSFNGEALDSV